jgi:energy-coupling factor transport system permease protein
MSDNARHVSETFAHRTPRSLHPIAWWLWALGLATACSRTTNPLLLGLVLAVLALVVTNRRSDAPWARAFKYYLVLAGVVVAIRVVFRTIFGGDIDASTMHVLFTLPHVPLPSWAAGVQIGGPVTLEGTLGALYGGLQLGVLLCCLGAANSLADPKRALRTLPGALYELGVAVVVAISVAPQLVESIQRVRRARRLRGGASRGFHALRSVAIPVLTDAFERSLRLAAAMDSRGYGRSAGASQRARRTTGALMISGMTGLCLGAYGLVDNSAPGALGLSSLAGGSALCVAGLVIGGRRVRATRYRPDRWRMPEWLVVLCGAVPAAVLLAGVGGGALNPSTDPPVWPPAPLLPIVAVLAAALAAVVAPPPPRPAVPAPTRPAGGAETSPAGPQDTTAPRRRSRRVPEPAELPA